MKYLKMGSICLLVLLTVIFGYDFFFGAVAWSRRATR